MNISAFINQAIEELIPDKGFSYAGAIVDEESFYEKFNIIVGQDENNSAILSNNKDDFGVTWDQVYNKVVELNNDFESKQYQRDRQYPEITDQLDMIYWDKKNGTKKWEEAIDKVKADNPKPE